MLKQASPVAMLSGLKQESMCMHAANAAGENQDEAPGTTL